MPNSQSGYKERPYSSQVRGYRDQRLGVPLAESSTRAAFPCPVSSENDRVASRAKTSRPEPGESPLPAVQIRAMFKARPGSEFIASADAISGLQRIIRTHRPRSVLEIGAGIGTLTFTLLDAYRGLGIDHGRLVTVEGNAFCAAQLRLNLSNEPRQPHIVEDVRAVEGQQFDLVIVDGGDERDNFVDFVAPRGVVFVEGYRAPQRAHISRSGRPFASANIRSLQQNHHRPSSAWGGAYWLYKFEPTLRERLTYARIYVWDGMCVTKRRAFKVATTLTSAWMRRVYFSLMLTGNGLE